MASQSLHDELIELAFAVGDGTATDAEIDRVEELLADDPAAPLLYLQCLELHFDMGRRVSTEDRQLADEPQQSPALPVIFDVSPTSPSQFFSPHSTVGGFLFSYAVAVLLTAVGLSIGWAWKVSRDQPIGPSDTPQTVQRTDASMVGRITDLANCRWRIESRESRVESEEGSGFGVQGSGNQAPSLKPQDPRPFVFLGDKYRLSSGLMEITYDTGAKVILQGPCVYEVDSPSSGFLQIGKLTALVEKRGEKPAASGQGLVASGRKIQQINKSTNQQISPLPFPELPGERTANQVALSIADREPTNSLAPRPRETEARGERGKGRGQRDRGPGTRDQIAANPKSPSPLFIVRTPTAVVTDLGTEFGVEVELAGATQSWVFQGKVEMRPLRGGTGGDGVLLSVNESARVERGANRVLLINDHSPSEHRRHSFARKMPEQHFTKVLNTGIGLKVGDEDSELVDHGHQRPAEVQTETGSRNND